MAAPDPYTTYVLVQATAPYWGPALASILGGLGGLAAGGGSLLTAPFAAAAAQGPAVAQTRTNTDFARQLSAQRAAGASRSVPMQGDPANPGTTQPTGGRPSVMDQIRRYQRFQQLFPQQQQQPQQQQPQMVFPPPARSGGPAIDPQILQLAMLLMQLANSNSGSLFGVRPSFGGGPGGVG